MDWNSRVAQNICEVQHPGVRLGPNTCRDGKTQVCEIDQHGLVFLFDGSLRRISGHLSGQYRKMVSILEFQVSSTLGDGLNSAPTSSNWVHAATVAKRLCATTKPRLFVPCHNLAKCCLIPPPHKYCQYMEPVMICPVTHMSLSVTRAKITVILNPN